MKVIEKIESPILAVNTLPFSKDSTNYQNIFYRNNHPQFWQEDTGISSHGRMPSDQQEEEFCASSKFAHPHLMFRCLNGPEKRLRC